MDDEDQATYRGLIQDLRITNQSLRLRASSRIKTRRMRQVSVTTQPLQPDREGNRTLADALRDSYQDDTVPISDKSDERQTAKSSGEEVGPDQDIQGDGSQRQHLNTMNDNSLQTSNEAILCQMGHLLEKLKGLNDIKGPNAVCQLEVKNELTPTPKDMGSLQALVRLILSKQMDWKFSDENELIRQMIDSRLLQPQRPCPKCNSETELCGDAWRCKRNTGARRCANVTVKAGSAFASTSLSLTTAFAFLFKFTMNGAEQQREASTAKWVVDLKLKCVKLAHELKVEEGTHDQGKLLLTVLQTFVVSY